MDVSALIFVVNTLGNIFVWIVVASVLLSFILPPYHPVREALDRIVEPFLNPIRSIVPPSGMFDFSPVVLIILIQVVMWILKAILVSLS
ncbi:MAG: YggT family protein [Chloroflexi bacterium]|nr:YggT family protein [Chloroflexota bacterium]